MAARWKSEGWRRAMWACRGAKVARLDQGWLFRTQKWSFRRDFSLIAKAETRRLGDAKTAWVLRFDAKRQGMRATAVVVMVRVLRIRRAVTGRMLMAIAAIFRGVSVRRMVAGSQNLGT
jgi:hypothetical protein